MNLFKRCSPEEAKAAISEARRNFEAVPTLHRRAILGGRSVDDYINDLQASMEIEVPRDATVFIKREEEKVFKSFGAQFRFEQIFGKDRTAQLLDPDRPDSETLLRELGVVAPEIPPTRSWVESLVSKALEKAHSPAARPAQPAVFSRTDEARWRRLLESVDFADQADKDNDEIPDRPAALARKFVRGFVSGDREAIRGVAREMGA